MAAQFNSWEEQLALFRLLREHKKAWWRAYLASPSLVTVATDYFRTSMKEDMIGTCLEEKVESAATLDRDTSVASDLLEDITAAELGSPFRHLSSDSVLCPTNQSFQEAADAARRAAIAYRYTHEKLVLLTRHLIHVFVNRKDPYYEDKFSEGMLGVIKAVHCFDPERGFRFSTCAAIWIKHYTTRFREKNTTVIRVPDPIQQLHRRVARVAQQIESEFGHTPELSEVRKTLEEGGKSIVGLKFLDAADVQVQSFEVASKEGARATQEFLSGPSPAYEDALDFAALTKTVDACLTEMTLLQREACEVALGRASETLQAVGTRHGLSRERIRQIGESMLERVQRRVRRSRTDDEGAR